MWLQYRIGLVACGITIACVAGTRGNPGVKPGESGKWAVRHSLAHQSSVTTVDFGSGVVAAGDRQGGLVLWDVKTGKPKQTVFDGKDKQIKPIERVQFSPDNQQLSVVTNDGYRIHQWSVKENFLIASEVDEKEQWRAQGVTPDGRSWIYGVGSRRLIVMRRTLGEKERVIVEGLHDHMGEIDLAAAGDEDVLVTVESGVLRRLEVKPDSPKWQVTLNKFDPVRLEIGPGGKHIAVSGQNGEVRLFVTKTGNSVGKFVGHKGPVWGLAFDPDGKRLVTGGEDKTVRVWDLETEKELAVLKEHTGAVLAVAFGPRDLIASGSDDKTVKVWELK